ncbi:amidohydrolase family protein [Rhodococcus sp. NPDC057529]|uniref:metal-dependent hydrolase family protein n=1 Tax=Rhodococcus sp. NPDC057529 TaxID=3346158 RepID=UPI0036720168
MHSLLVKNADVLDIHTGNYHRLDIRCSSTIGEMGLGLAPSPNELVIDATGKFVIPGLIDCHVHVTAANASLGVNRHTSPSYVTARAIDIMSGMLDRGFTTVRDVGGADHGLAAAQREGFIVGPTLMFGGPALSQTGGHGDFRAAADSTHDVCCHGIGRIADGVDEIRRAVRDEIRRGADHIKIMASGGIASPTDRIDSIQYSLEEMRTAVEEATAANRYVAAHAYTPRAINRALEAGVRSIEHGNLLDESSIELFIDHEAFLVPTICTYHALVQEGQKHGQTEEQLTKARTVLDKAIDGLAAAHEAGVKIAYGSDLIGGMHRLQCEEFKIRSSVMTNLAVLQSATVVAAQLINRDGEVGQISRGSRADLLILSADPLRDIDAVADPGKYLDMVIQDGSIRRDMEQARNSSRAPV